MKKAVNILVREYRCSAAQEYSFFTLRSHICQLLIGHIFTWAMLQQKFAIFVNMQAVRFCHLNHCVDYRTGICALYGIAEQPVFPAYCEWTNCILTEIVGKAVASVFQIGLTSSTATVMDSDR